MGLTFKLNIFAFFIALISYLLGSLNFAVIITKLFSKNDIRDMGSKNAGATNVLRTVGWKACVLTLAGDLLKVVVATSIARMFLSGEMYSGLRVLGTYWAGFFCVLGHLYPIYFRFKGGKGVMTSAGMILVIDYRIFFILIGIFTVLVLTTRYVSLASIISAALFPVATWFLYVESPAAPFEKLTRLLQFFYSNQRGAVTLMAAGFAFIVIFKHHENIKRLINGTESKISFKRSK